MNRSDVERLRELCTTAGTYLDRLTEAEGAEYRALRQKLLAVSGVENVLPPFLRDGATPEELRNIVRSAAGTGYQERRALIQEGFTRVIGLVAEGERAPDFARNAEEFASRVIQLLMAKGLTRAVGTVTFGRLSLEIHCSAESWDGDGWPWELRIELPVKIYTRWTTEDLRLVAKDIQAAATEIVRAANGDDVIRGVDIYVDAEPLDEWRKTALAWLKGEGINNQGRVRSDNLPVRQVEGLLFRSKPEVNLFYALKKRGIVFAPLPVFLRGGDQPKRIEPDFFILADGEAMIVEVDGDAYHTENPAEADERVRMMKHHGVHIERVKAADCGSQADAERSADKIVQAIESYRRSR